MNQDLHRGSRVSGSPLVARSRWVDDEYLHAARKLALQSGCVLERDGLAIFAVGCALEVRLPDGIVRNSSVITDVLQEIESRSQTCLHRIVALAALPYDLSSSCAFEIGEITVVHRVGDAPYAVFVGVEDALAEISNRNLVELVQDQGSHGVPSPPEHFALDPVIAHEQFRSKVEMAIGAIAQNRMQKVVLAREVVVGADRPFLQHELLERLRTLHPSCLSFAIHGFIGATPELLLRKTGSESLSTPLAGTAARSGDPEEDRKLALTLMTSAKERSEHRYVVEEICENLRYFTENVSAPSDPHILELRNVVHLATTISASQIRPEVTSLEIACRLHPTPAVCGTPRQSAADFIKAHEGLSRGLYAGLVGYTEACGDGEWWIGIRSAMIDGARARMIAGVGIVADSDPEAEFAETQLKLQAMLAVLVRP